MPQVFTRTVVGAPVGEVWALLRDFAATGSWHPTPPPCEIETGRPTGSGASWSSRSRAITGRPLVSLDDHHRAIAFTFGDNVAGLRVRRYVSTMAARPITFSNHAYVEWSSQFDRDEVDEADRDKVITQV
jgi:NADPH2:quinone reductase